MKKENELRNKKRTAVVLLLLGGVLLTGTLFACFSDIIFSTGNVTAGSLDIVGDYEFYQNYVADTDTPLAVDLPNIRANFNPGGTLVIKATITNDGSKSAWIRNGIHLEGDLLDVLTPSSESSVITVYAGALTQAEALAPESAEDIVLLVDSTYSSATSIINGSVETETGGLESYTVAYTVYFEAAAGNNAQAQSLEITAQTQALQYRNTSAPATESGWSVVVSEAFSLSD